MNFVPVEIGKIYTFTLKRGALGFFGLREGKNFTGYTDRVYQHEGRLQNGDRFFGFEKWGKIFETKESVYFWIIVVPPLEHLRYDLGGRNQWQRHRNVLFWWKRSPCDNCILCSLSDSSILRVPKIYPCKYKYSQALGKSYINFWNLA